ncbi:hypothetical protein SNE40_022959 [Patella caerulea]|uniref:Uncharacterized protein n=1 Tax=Patella caerulea TaxID=87958 RepID=A0AAN8J420_PATCE
MMKMILCLTVVLCLSAVTSLPTREATKIIKWTREIEKSQKIDEQAEIYPDEQILMKSTDVALNKHKFQRSESWHDYQTKELAIKFIDHAAGNKPVCFLTNVKKSYQDTVADLSEREGKTIPAVGDRNLVIESSKPPAVNSNNIKIFCKDSSIYQVRESTLGSDKPQELQRLAPVIVRTLCFYGPVDIFTPYDLYELIFTIFPIFYL